MSAPPWLLLYWAPLMRCSSKVKRFKHGDTKVHEVELALSCLGILTSSFESLFFYSALMGAGNAHVFPVLGYGAASDLNSLRLQDAGELLVGKRTARIFFIDQLLDAALQNQQRRIAALRPLHALAEEITQFEYALRLVGIFSGQGAARQCGRG